MTLPRFLWRTTRAGVRVGTRAGLYGGKVVGKAVAGRVVRLPEAGELPPGRVLELPASPGYSGGRTLVVDAGRQSNLAAHGIGGLLGQDGRPAPDFYADGRSDLAKYPAVEVREGEVVSV